MAQRRHAPERAVARHHRASRGHPPHALDGAPVTRALPFIAALLCALGLALDAAYPWASRIPVAEVAR